MANLAKKANEVSVLACKGFRYINEYAALVLLDGDKNVSTIVGRKADHPMSELMLVKGHDIEVRYVSEVATSSGKYHRVYIECIL